MKRYMALFMALCFMSFTTGCGDAKTINGVKYETYGFFNKDTNRSPNIKYTLIWGNIIWSFLLVETIIAPVYFVGWSIMEPVGPNDCSDNVYRAGCKDQGGDS